MSDERFDRLTEGQCACLRLVYARWEIKQIARELDIAPATVNQRLTAARRVLGTSRSIDAARMFHEYERSRIYIPPIYTSEGVEPSEISSEVVPDDDSTVAKGTYDTGEATRASPLAWPLPTTARPRNDLGFAQKLAWIIVIAAGSMIAFGMMITSLDTLSRLL